MESIAFPVSSLALEGTPSQVKKSDFGRKILPFRILLRVVFISYCKSAIWRHLLQFRFLSVGFPRGLILEQHTRQLQKAALEFRKS